MEQGESRWLPGEKAELEPERFRWQRDHPDGKAPVTARANRPASGPRQKKAAAAWSRGWSTSAQPEGASFFRPRPQHALQFFLQVAQMHLFLVDQFQEEFPDILALRLLGQTAIEVQGLGLEHHGQVEDRFQI